MSSPAGAPTGASFVVINPSGNRTRAVIEPLPFIIGRQADCQLVLRDSRVSRQHVRILKEGDSYILEDLNSRHGVLINGAQVKRHELKNSDSVEFGVQDSYRLIFMVEDDEIHKLIDQVAHTQKSDGTGAGNLSKLRALVEVARALQNSLSTEDVLSAVVDAALTVTGSERGFLMLRNEDDLEICVARNNRGAPLGKDDLKVPTRLINRALSQRRELLSMNFDPMAASGVSPDMSVEMLALRSVVCVPLVRLRSGSGQETSIRTTNSETVGLLYLDSRAGAADLSMGNRELLQTLALETSTILENSRLLEEERSKQRLEEQLALARNIQNGLLPRSLPRDGWFRAAGWSIPSHQVGGDYYDVRKLNDDCWVTVVADVSGKGVSSALLASLLQGAFLLASEGADNIEMMMRRINLYLVERAHGEKYATLFFCNLRRDGLLQYANAGHCAPIVVSKDGELHSLHANSMPIGLIGSAPYRADEYQLKPGDKVVCYSDGLSEAQNAAEDFFEVPRIEAALRANYVGSCEDVLKAIKQSVQAFTEEAPQGDDMTLVVFEYLP
jgi:sigma-B regulation protein RsbU (phosphoserine phosphatase)